MTIPYTYYFHYFTTEDIEDPMELEGNWEEVPVKRARPKSGEKISIINQYT